jgi:superfamily II DNA/RNA helicase
VQESIVNLGNVQHVVMDEADRLFDLGFLDQVDTIMAACTSPNLRKYMFSATMMQGVEVSFDFTHKWMDAWMDILTDGWMDGWMNG